MKEQDIKSELLQELDSRISRLKEHLSQEQVTDENQYGALNQAMSKAIGIPLQKELEDLKEFTENL